nr:hypothetical protein [Tanacetum cinerariifolium]
MDQSGSGVAGLSSSGKGLNQSAVVVIFGRWAFSVSYGSETCSSSRIGMSRVGPPNGDIFCSLDELDGVSLVFVVVQNPLEEEEDLDHRYLEEKEDLDRRDVFSDTWTVPHEVLLGCHDPSIAPEHYTGTHDLRGGGSERIVDEDSIVAIVIRALTCCRVGVIVRRSTIGVDNGGAEVLTGSYSVAASLKKSSPKLSVSSRFFIEECVPDGLVGSSRMIFSSVMSLRILWTSGRL